MKDPACLDVLLLTWNFPPQVGGIEYLVWHLYTEMTCRGDCQVRALTSKASRDHTDAAPAHGEVFRAPIGGLPAFNGFALFGGLRQVWRRRPDVILCASLAAAVPAFLLKVVARRPMMLITYGSDLVIASRPYQRLIRFLLRRVERVVAISEHTAELLKAKGVPAERIAIIPPGLAIPDEETYARSREEHGAEYEARLQGRKLVLAAGRLVRRKGFYELVAEIWPRVLQACPDAVLMIVGDDPRGSLIHKERMSERIRERISALGLAESVFLLGRVTDGELQALFQRARVFAMPCLDIANDVEGFGIVFQEAAAVAVPSVSTRVGGVPDAVEDGVTGILNTAGDSPAIAESLVMLLKDDEVQSRMGQAAQQRARTEFAWPVVTGRYVEALRALAANRC